MARHRDTVQSVLSKLVPHAECLQREHGILSQTLTELKINREPRLRRLKRLVDALTSDIEAIVAEVNDMDPDSGSAGGTALKFKPSVHKDDAADSPRSTHQTQTRVSARKRTHSSKMPMIKLIIKGKEKKKRTQKSKQEFELCGEKFIDRPQHMKLSHPSETMVRCTVCSIKFDDPLELRKHKALLHKSTGFGCDLCGKVFKGKRCLRQHLANHLRQRSQSTKQPKSRGPRCTSHLCDICGKSFLKPQYLSLHRRRGCNVDAIEKAVNKKLPEFVCVYCHRRYHTKEELEIHVKRHNRTCEVCGKKFSTRTHLLTHLRSHKIRERHPCSYCRNVFSSVTALNMHMNVHLGKRPFQCTECDESFASISARSNHVRRKHHMQRALIYKCKMCGKGFYQKEVRETHYISHHSKDELAAHGISIEMFECHICGKMLRKMYYKTHMKRHAASHDRPFECEVCFKKFSSAHSLRQHSYLHDVDKELKGGDNVCNICGEAYKTPAALKIHQLQKHIGVKKPLYKCEFCHKEFSYNFYFTRHKCLGKPVSHRPISFTASGEPEPKIEKEKEHVCDICGKGYERYGVFLRHKKAHEGVAILSTCHVCNKGFIRDNDLRDHMTTEHPGVKPYKCSTCGLEFTNYNNLNRHKKLHLGEKKFQCDYCGRQFSQKNNMIIHRRKHTGEKPFQCDICGMRFSDPSTAYKHKAKHNKKDAQAAAAVATQETLAHKEELPVTYNIQYVEARDAGHPIVYDKPHEDHQNRAVVYVEARDAGPPVIYDKPHSDQDRSVVYVEARDPGPSIVYEKPHTDHQDRNVVYVEARDPGPAIVYDKPHMDQDRSVMYQNYEELYAAKSIPTTYQIHTGDDQLQTYEIHVANEVLPTTYEVNGNQIIQPTAFFPFHHPGGPVE